MLGLIIASDRATIERAVQVFARSKYHKPAYARALFLKSRILLKLGETRGGKHALAQSAATRQQLTPNDTRSADMLSQKDFDRLLPLWFR